MNRYRTRLNWYKHRLVCYRDKSLRDKKMLDILASRLYEKKLDSYGLLQQQTGQEIALQALGRENYITQNQLRAQ